MHAIEIMYRRWMIRRRAYCAGVMFVSLMFVSLMFVGLLTGTARADDSDRPNILLFITDDESWLERSIHGWSDLPTPAFDRVAKEGALFTHGFTSAPSCAPSRASILSGRNFWELRQGAFIQAYVPQQIPLFTHVLARHGYHVGNTGKGWGPGVTIDESHDQMIGKTYDAIELPEPIPGISPIDYAENFRQFLDDRDQDQPFFFWAGIHEPHGPYGDQNHQRLADQFGMSPDTVPMPPVMDDSEANRIERGNTLYEIAYADQQLSRMLDLLERTGQDDNTLVVVTSDNGSVVLDGESLRAKASPYDNGVHVPLAIRWPAKMPGGRTVTDFVSLIDLAPTFLQLAGIPVPDGMSGKSLVPILRSEQSGRIDPSRSSVVTGLEWHGEFDPASRSSRSIRNDRFSYIVRYGNIGGSQWATPIAKEFYDVANDPWEQHNLIDDPQYTDDIASLSSQLEQYQRQTGDPRITDDQDIFRRTRDYVQKRKRVGYDQTLTLPFE
ncbi:sulfatase family protein [Rhodopirellula sallentina]|uniref:Heparan N-sulfatase n=1 Tax=Rhodopirellula sallentina SM41 TaxID=1263870 RepID=M5UIU3_9BACT|nr:sulfatase [Rhodopirellula sallentina]EMI57751.1 heparan N-sulfatase [Rhodopirellula sallentina SM41]